MALRGNLRDFSLPDVFQLVTFSRKTGVLRIKSASGAEGSVWFRDGEVFFAASNWRTEPIGERLVRAQRLTPQALERALGMRAQEGPDGRRLGQILIDEGYITDKVLETFVQEQIQDTIFDLMRWDEGDFDFEAMPEAVEEDIGLTVSIENVVMEGSRRLEEWNRIKKKIPSMDVVFKMATAPGEGTFEISLKPMEWQLLLLIDSTRSVSELASATGRTDFEVARVIYGLFSAGLLEFASDEEIAHNRAEREQREARLAHIVEERRKVEEAEKSAALEREAALQATAEKRGETGVEKPVSPTSAPPAEVPTFLGGTAAAPTAEDQSALEEFMGALLGPTEAQVEPVKPSRIAEPHVPAEEPAFIGAASSSEPDVAIEDLLGMKPQVVEPTVPDELVADVEPSEASPESAAAVVIEPEPTPVGDAVTEPSTIPEMGTDFTQPEATEVEAAEEPFEVDFERDLMALGLGELPGDLLEPVEPMSSSAEVLVEPAIEWSEPGGAAEAVEEAASVDSDLGFDVDGPVPEVVYEVPVDEIEIPAEDMDFSALIESLDVDADDFTVLPSGPSEAVAEETGFDEELLRDDTPVESGRVISTDAFLSDITMDDLGFSGGLTDELSALTGAERKPARPQASVNAIPDENAAVLKRDMRVDKDTVLKIIDGIKSL